MSKRNPVSGVHSFSFPVLGHHHYHFHTYQSIYRQLTPTGFDSDCDTLHIARQKTLVKLYCSSESFDRKELDMENESKVTGNGILAVDLMMDWNANSSLLWDWDNHEHVGGVYKLSSSAAVAAGGGDGGSYGSDLGNGSSSKSTISASTASSKTAKSSDWEANPKNYDNNILSLENGSSPAAAQAAGLEESQIGLKLGKRTYFENVSAESSGKNPLSALDSVAASGSLAKKSKACHQSAQSTYCQVQGCSVDLNGAKDYHRKHRVCETHSKCPKVVVGGQERRFCQQCSRFHDLSEFDQKKRSCRRRLSDHNARRRKPRPNIISFSSTHTPFYVVLFLVAKGYIVFINGKHHLNFLWNLAAFDHGRTMVSTAIQDSQNFKFTQMKGPWIKPTKECNIDGHLNLPSSHILNGFSSLYHDGDKLLPCRGTAAEVLNQGSEASAGASNLDGAPGVGRALSLLSATSWVSPDPRHTSSIVNFVDAGHVSTEHHLMPMANTSSNWMHGQALCQPPQMPPFTIHRNSIQPQLQKGLCRLELGPSCCYSCIVEKLVGFSVDVHTTEKLVGLKEMLCFVFRPKLLCLRQFSVVKLCEGAELEACHSISLTVMKEPLSIIVIKM
ncbi:hypothetical protein ZIOFF_032002 [Zingiber officinale]|uniref:SBP-type domain-containing protein n=1 Tax=Zingiber officinale TaxID=94328 RepID=A0A8J5L5Y6_ZINOF|nr:hypothetical protein ZIOFF_032002 [Zingiber officinale]